MVRGEKIDGSSTPDVGLRLSWRHILCGGDFGPISVAGGA